MFGILTRPLARRFFWSTSLTAAFGASGFVWAGGPVAPGVPCVTVPCVPNVKDFGYYPTKWRRWPGDSGAMASAPSGERSESIKRPGSDTQLPAGVRERTTPPPLDSTTPTIPPSQPAPMGTVPDSTQPPMGTNQPAPMPPDELRNPNVFPLDPTNPIVPDPFGPPGTTTPQTTPNPLQPGGAGTNGPTTFPTTPSPFDRNPLTSPTTPAPGSSPTTPGTPTTPGPTTPSTAPGFPDPLDPGRTTPPGSTFSPQPAEGPVMPKRVAGATRDRHEQADSGSQSESGTSWRAVGRVKSPAERSVMVSSDKVRPISHEQPAPLEEVPEATPISGPLSDEEQSATEDGGGRVNPLRSPETALRWQPLRPQKAETSADEVRPASFQSDPARVNPLR